MAEIKLTKDNFETEVLNSNMSVLVDFWAEWCGPCKMIAPIIKEIADEITVKVGKVNVDEEAELAQAFGIASIPTLLVFKGGKLVNKGIGYMSKEEVLKLINA